MRRLLIVVGCGVLLLVALFSQPVPRGMGLLMIHIALSRSRIEVPPGTRILPDQVYARRGERALHLDLHLPPDADEPVPVILWLHGGGFRAGDQKQLQPAVVRQLERGWAVASVEYSLAHEGSWPVPGEDVAASVRWLRSNASRHGLDASTIVAWGESAGATLAAHLGTAREGQLGNPELGPQGRSSRVQGVVGWYPPTDFVARAAAGEGGFTSAGLLGCAPAECPERAVDASPTHHASADAPPFLLQHGTSDTLVSATQSRLLAEALLAAGAIATLELYEGYVHGDVRFNESPALASVEHFLDARRSR